MYICLLLFSRLCSMCSHVVAILFKVEACHRTGLTTSAPTSEPCAWNQDFVKKVCFKLIIFVSVHNLLWCSRVVSVNIKYFWCLNSIAVQVQVNCWQAQTDPSCWGGTDWPWFPPFFHSTGEWCRGWGNLEEGPPLLFSDPMPNGYLWCDFLLSICVYTQGIIDCLSWLGRWLNREKLGKN